MVLKINEFYAEEIPEGWDVGVTVDTIPGQVLKEIDIFNTSGYGFKIGVFEGNDVDNDEYSAVTMENCIFQHERWIQNPLSANTIESTRGVTLQVGIPIRSSKITFRLVNIVGWGDLEGLKIRVIWEVEKLKDGQSFGSFIQRL